MRFLNSQLIWTAVIQYHFVWVTKYRYHILKGEIALRARELIRQSCEACGISILGGYERAAIFVLLLASLLRI